MYRSIKSLIATSILVSISGITPSLAASDAPKQPEMQNHGNMDHSKMNHSQMHSSEMTEKLPTEPGQGAFATIAEIVVLLSNDPKTDWSKVDIDGLREHLVDMNELSLRANSKTTMFEDKIVFTVTGTGRTRKAIQSMIPAHASVLARTTAWDIKGKLIEDGATLTIFSNKPTVLKIVEALGFYGVMATGAHHQAHHLAMARGEGNVHAHN